MIIHSSDTHHPFNRFYIITLKKNKKILSSLLVSLICFGLVMGAAGANEDSSAGQDHQRKASFSADDWPKGVERFIKVESKLAPVMTAASYNTDYFAVATSGEIFQYLDQRTVITFGNPLGGSTDGNMTWYKVRMLDGMEGWLPGPPRTSYFEAKRIYPEDIGAGSTPIKKKVFVVHSKQPLALDFGSMNVQLSNGGYLLVDYENSDYISLETPAGDRRSWDRKELMKYGSVDTISWYAEWDDIRKRTGPIILFILSALLITPLVPVTIYNDPRHKEKAIRKLIFFIYFGFLLFAVLAHSSTLFKGSLYINEHLSMRRYDSMFREVFLYMLLPYGIVVLSYFEGFTTLLIRLKYIYTGKSAKEALMERAIKKEDEKKSLEYETKMSDIEQQQATVEQKLSNIRHDVPEVIDTIPRDITDYQGYWLEVEKRFQERQVIKTTKIARERLEEVRKLCEEGARLQRARADLQMANHEFSTVDKEISLKDKERILKDKILDRDILETDADIARLKRMSEKKEEREDFGI